MRNSAVPNDEATRDITIARGFTLIELMVVMAIIATLISIAAPRYFNHVDRAREASLKQSLSVMRDAIDKFHGDSGRYPESLDELVTKRYLRKVPADPLTDSTATWVIQAPPEPPQTNQATQAFQASQASQATLGAVYDVRSGAPGEGADGKSYAEW